MKFYNREYELARLKEIASLSVDSAHLMVLTGRRRVGKTELIRKFAEGQEHVLYFFVSKKKPLVLLEEFRELLSARIPILKTVVFNNFRDFFAFLFMQMEQQPLFIIFDEFQNFQQVDPSVFSTLQDIWDRQKDVIKGTIICVGSVQTLMQEIFEGAEEPLFGRVTARLYLKPLAAYVVADLLREQHVEPAKQLLFYYTLFGGIPKYYFLLDRYRLFGKNRTEIIRKFFCESDALLQQEGKELLIEEFGKNYHLYFSILQVIAGGVTQMARIADCAGINVNSISKYLEELTSSYQIIERRVPVTETRNEQKIGRYYLKDQLLRFWFRYIFSNQSMIAIGDEAGLLAKIEGDLQTLLGWSFEDLIRTLLLERNDTTVIPFRFSKIGGFWNKSGDVEIDIVALDEDQGNIIVGECKLNGNRFTSSEARRLKVKAGSISWRKGSRKEHYALFCLEDVSASTARSLVEEGVSVYTLENLLRDKGRS
jgi:AAA+ ATPase superfamily predicted ATPase